MSAFLRRIVGSDTLFYLVCFVKKVLFYMNMSYIFPAETTHSTDEQIFYSRAHSGTFIIIIFFSGIVAYLAIE